MLDAPEDVRFIRGEVFDPTNTSKTPAILYISSTAADTKTEYHIEIWPTADKIVFIKQVGRLYNPADPVSKYEEQHRSGNYVMVQSQADPSMDDLNALRDLFTSLLG